MPLLKEALNLLQESDLKVTDRRKSIIKLMYKENRYLSATEVRNLLKHKFPGISPDTIYRNLHSFSDLNILEETEFDGEKFFRANCSVGEHHHHFICTECGNSIELSMCPASYFQDEIGEAKVTFHRFELFGLCEECLQKES